MKKPLVDFDEWDIHVPHVIANHRIAIRFRDGLAVELDMGPWLRHQKGHLARALLCEELFSQVKKEMGVLRWPNGYEINPIALREWAEQGFCGHR